MLCEHSPLAHFKATYFTDSSQPCHYIVIQFSIINRYLHALFHPSHTAVCRRLPDSQIQVGSSANFGLNTLLMDKDVQILSVYCPGNLYNGSHVQELLTILKKQNSVNTFYIITLSRCKTQAGHRYQ